MEAIVKHDVEHENPLLSSREPELERSREASSPQTSPGPQIQPDHTSEGEHGHLQDSNSTIEASNERIAGPLVNREEQKGPSVPSPSRSTIYEHEYRKPQQQQDDGQSHPFESENGGSTHSDLTSLHRDRNQSNSNASGVPLELTQQDHHEYQRPHQMLARYSEGSSAGRSTGNSQRVRKGGSEESNSPAEPQKKRERSSSVGYDNGEMHRSAHRDRSSSPRSSRPLPASNSHYVAFLEDDVDAEEKEEEGSRELGRPTFLRENSGRPAWRHQPMARTPDEERRPIEPFSRRYSSTVSESLDESGESGYSGSNSGPDSLSREEFIARQNERISSRPPHEGRAYQPRLQNQDLRGYSRPRTTRGPNFSNPALRRPSISSTGPSRDAPPYYFRRVAPESREIKRYNEVPSRRSSRSVPKGVRFYDADQPNSYAGYDRHEFDGPQMSRYPAPNPATFIASYGDGDEVYHGHEAGYHPSASAGTRFVRHEDFESGSDSDLDVEVRRPTDGRFPDRPASHSPQERHYFTPRRRNSFHRERDVFDGTEHRYWSDSDDWESSDSDTEADVRIYRRKPSRIYSSDDSGVIRHPSRSARYAVGTTFVDPDHRKAYDSDLPSEPEPVSPTPTSRDWRHNPLVQYRTRVEGPPFDEPSQRIRVDSFPRQPYRWTHYETGDDMSEDSRFSAGISIESLSKRGGPDSKPNFRETPRESFRAPVSSVDESQDITSQLNWKITSASHLPLARSALSGAPVGSVDYPSIQIIRALVPELSSGGNWKDTITINRCGTGYPGRKSPEPDLTWIHLQQDTLSLERLSEFVSRDGRLDEQYRAIALELLRKQCTHFERVILQGNMKHNILQPGTVFRCDGPHDPKGKEAAKYVIFCAVPFFEALNPPQIRRSHPHGQGDHLIRNLEQQIYDCEFADGREHEQIFQRTKIVRDQKEIICVPQVWFLICGNVVISCAHLRQEQLCGEAVNINEPSSAKIVVSVRIPNGEIFNAILERSASYFVVLRTIREKWSSFGNETLGLSDLVLADGTTLTTSRWNELIRENVSWLKVEIEAKSNRPDLNKALVLFRRRGTYRDISRHNSHHYDDTMELVRWKTFKSPKHTKPIINDMENTIPTPNAFRFKRVDSERSGRAPQPSNRAVHFSHTPTDTYSDDGLEQAEFDAAAPMGPEARDLLPNIRDGDVPFLSWPIFDASLRGEGSLKRVLDSIKANLSGDPNFAQRMNDAPTATLQEIIATQRRITMQEEPGDGEANAVNSQEANGKAPATATMPAGVNGRIATSHSDPGDIYSTLRNMLAQSIDTMISRSTSLILQFIPEEHGHLLVLELWGNLHNIQKHANEILRTPPLTPNGQVKYFPRLHLEESQAGGLLLTTYPLYSLRGCARCQGGFKSLSKGSKHLVKKHFGGINHPHMVKWLRDAADVPAFRTEVASTILIEFVHSLELVLSKTTELHEAASDDKECMNGLAIAFSDIFVLFAYVSRKLTKIHSSASLDELMPPRNQKDLSSYSKIRFLSDAIVKSVKGAANDIMISSISSHSDGAFRSQPVEPQFLALVIANNLFGRQIRTASGEYFDLIQMYHEEIARIQLQIKRRPMKSLYLDIATLDEELQALRKVYGGQLRFCRDMSRVLKPSSFRVTTEKRCNSFGLESQYLDKTIRRLKARQDEIEGIQARAKQLYKKLNYVLGIQEESNHNAIWVFTLVTVFFLPLSFVTSFFGMNLTDIREIEQTQSLFWAAAVPTTVVVLTFTYVYGYKWQDWKENGKKSLKVMAEPWTDDTEDHQTTTSSSKMPWLRRVAFRGKNGLPRDVEGRSGTFDIGKNTSSKPRHQLSWAR